MGRTDHDLTRQALPPVPRRIATDEQLVEAVRGGSQQAFRTIYERNHAVVRGLCRRMLGSSEEADDVVQHAFMAAYVDIMGTPKRLVLRPWLLSIASHRCLTVLASRRRPGVWSLQEPASPGFTLDLGIREDLRAVFDDIAALPEEQRTALVLRALGGASYAEIARTVGAPEGRGRALVFQARSWLRASRRAREIPCAEIRDKLASSQGAMLRRNELRHHLRQCDGCRAFSAALRARRRRHGSWLPLPRSSRSSGQRSERR